MLVVWLYAGGVSLISSDVRFGTVSLVRSQIYVYNSSYVDPFVPKPKKPFDTNWTLCALCQEDT